MQAVAQRNVFVWNDGNLKVVSSASIDSVTLSVDKWLFRIVTYPAVDVSEHEFVTVGTVALAESVKKSARVAHHRRVLFSEQQAAYRQRPNHDADFRLWSEVHQRVCPCERYNLLLSRLRHSPWRNLLWKRLLRDNFRQEAGKPYQNNQRSSLCRPWFALGASLG